MGLNAIALGLLALAILLHVYSVYSSEPKAPTELPWVPIQAGKQRSFHSQTRDASMYTERMRRTAIISNPDLVVGNKSSGNGSLEWNFLTGICVCPPRKRPVCPPPEYIADAGNATSDVCDIIDGSGSEVLDFGDSSANVCDV